MSSTFSSIGMVLDSLSYDPATSYLKDFRQVDYLLWAFTSSSVQQEI